MSAYFTITTESGAEYSYDPTGPRILRHGFGGELRRDHDWINLLEPIDVIGLKLGAGLRLVMEPLAADAQFTVRLTTPVVGVRFPAVNS